MTNGELTRHHPAAAVRTWRVELSPTATIAAIANTSGLRAAKAREEQSTARLDHRGTIFVDDRDETRIVLWRRPTRTWAYKFAGLMQPVPYPPLLVVCAKAEAGGTLVTVRFERHPATGRHLVFEACGVLALVAMYTLIFASGSVSFSTATTLVLAGIVWISATVSRFVTMQQAKDELLRVAYAPLAPHELGAADHERLAFRKRALPEGSSRQD